MITKLHLLALLDSFWGDPIEGFIMLASTTKFVKDTCGSFMLRLHFRPAMTISLCKY